MAVSKPTPPERKNAVLNKGTADGHAAAGRLVPLSEWNTCQHQLLFVLTKFLKYLLHGLFELLQAQAHGVLLPNGNDVGGLVGGGASDSKDATILHGASAGFAGCQDERSERGSSYVRITPSNLPFATSADRKCAVESFPTLRRQLGVVRPMQHNPHACQAAADMI